jgi:hypothetical protein
MFALSAAVGRISLRLVFHANRCLLYPGQPSSPWLHRRPVMETRNTTVPPRIIMQRSVASGFFYAFCVVSAMMVLVYFLAI